MKLPAPSILVNPFLGMSMRRMLSRLAHVALLLLFAFPGLAAETTAPSRFRAYIGGFLGSSYTIELRDGSLICTSVESADRRKREETINPTAAEWREFRQALDDLKVWQWQADYPNRGTMDGTQWSFEIAYPDRTLKTQGDNRYPDASGKPGPTSEPTEYFKRYLAAIKKLTGGRSFK
jgi:hypothetical protein